VWRAAGGAADESKYSHVSDDLRLLHYWRCWLGSYNVAAVRPVVQAKSKWQRGAQKLMLFRRAGLFKGGSKTAARQSPPNTTTPAARKEAVPVLRLNSECTLHVRNIAGDTPVSHGSEKTFEQYRFRSTSTAGQKLLSCWLRICYVLRSRSA
jgi:hypothetical protein